MRRIGCAGALMLLLAGCGGDLTVAPGDTPYAVAVNACGPADGPATRIYLAPTRSAQVPPPPPYTHIEVSRDIEQLAGTTFTLGAADAEAFAAYVTGPETSVIATEGQVTFDEQSPDGRLNGSVNITFPDRGLVGTFSAVVKIAQLLCP